MSLQLCMRIICLSVCQCVLRYLFGRAATQVVENKLSVLQLTGLCVLIAPSPVTHNAVLYVKVIL